jgi:hypothetical protein
MKGNLNEGAREEMLRRGTDLCGVDYYATLLSSQWRCGWTRHVTNGKGTNNQDLNLVFNHGFSQQIRLSFSNKQKSRVVMRLIYQSAWMCMMIFNE